MSITAQGAVAGICTITGLFYRRKAPRAFVFLEDLKYPAWWDPRWDVYFLFEALLENSSPISQGCVMVPDTQLRTPQVEPGMVFIFYFLESLSWVVARGFRKVLACLQALYSKVLKTTGRLWFLTSSFEENLGYWFEVWPYQDRDWNPNLGIHLTLTWAAMSTSGEQGRLWCCQSFASGAGRSISLAALCKVLAGMGMLFTLGTVVFLQESHCLGTADLCLLPI